MGLITLIKFEKFFFFQNFHSFFAIDYKVMEIDIHKMYLVGILYPNCFNDLSSS